MLNFILHLSISCIGVIILFLFFNNIKIKNIKFCLLFVLICGIMKEIIDWINGQDIINGLFDIGTDIFGILISLVIILMIRRVRNNVQIF
jgi:hypothetical protein